MNPLYGQRKPVRLEEDLELKEQIIEQTEGVVPWATSVKIVVDSALAARYAGKAPGHEFLFVFKDQRDPWVFYQGFRGLVCEFWENGQFGCAAEDPKETLAKAPIDTDWNYLYQHQDFLQAVFFDYAVYVAKRIDDSKRIKIKKHVQAVQKLEAASLQALHGIILDKEAICRREGIVL